MNRSLLIAGAGLLAVALLPGACKKDETTANNTTTTTTTTSTTTSSTSTGGTGGAGGAACSCNTCGDYLALCIAGDGVCPTPPAFCGLGGGGGGAGPTEDALNTLFTCLCNACSVECALTCTGSGTNNACGACWSAESAGGCLSDYNYCAQDPCPD